MGHSISLCSWTIIRSGSVQYEAVRTPRILGLEPSQRDTITLTWADIKDHVVLGQRIFSRIFAINPVLKKSFNLQDISADEFQDNSRFKSHAMNFTRFLEGIAENIENEEVMLQMARRIGVLHVEVAKFDVSLFDAEYWMLFASSAVSEITDAYHRDVSAGRWHRVGNATLQRVWHALMIRLVLEMKVTFYKELLRRSTLVYSAASCKRALKEASTNTCDRCTQTDI